MSPMDVKVVLGFISVNQFVEIDLRCQYIYVSDVAS